MSARCTGEPVSWLRLERYHAGDGGAEERARIAEHLGTCPACAACLERIEQDETHALPALPVVEPVKRGVLVRWPLRVAAGMGALAAAAAVVLALRVTGPATDGSTETPGTRVKGDAVAFSLVRDDGERIDGTEGVYRDGDRFKAVVTCPPGAGMAFDLVVYDPGGASFPLEAAGMMACGNDVPMRGAFRLTGRDDETVCVAWSTGGPVDRQKLAAAPPATTSGLCKKLSSGGAR